MSNNLANYSLEELVEIQEGIDRDNHHTRYDEVSSLIEKKIGQQLAEEAVPIEYEPISNKLLAGLCVLSGLVVLKVFFAIQNGVVGLRRFREVTVAEDPIMFWSAITVWVFVAAVPPILLAQKLYRKEQEPAE